MNKARDASEEVVKLGLAPMLKKHGFKKTGLHFARRRGAAAHYLNVRLSSWNQGMEGSFYLNAGLMFDEVCKHYGRQPPLLPKYDDCDFMIRLERLNPSLPPQFCVDETTSLEALARKVSSAVEQTFVEPSAHITSLRDLGGTGWVEAIPWGFPALFHFLTGDEEEARRLVQLEASTFADRGLTFESVAQSLQLRFSQPVR